MRNLIKVAVALTIFLAGCTDKEAQKQKENESMVRAIEYVDAIHSSVTHPQDLGELIMGVGKERKAQYVQNLKRTPLEGCPDDFKEAFQRHIEAWKDGDGNGDDIDRTGQDVMAIARMHGVK